MSAFGNRSNCRRIFWSMSDANAHSANSAQHPNSIGIALPIVFVALYGSAFPAAKAGLSDAGVFEFLGLRYLLAAVLLSIVARVVRVPWPRKRRDLLHICVAGLLMVGIFNAAAFSSVALGVPPAVCALIIALQPIAVALGAKPLLGERISGQQWVGLLLGAFGVYFVVSGNLVLDVSYLKGIGFALIALLSLATGNLYQKRFCAHMDILSGGVVQNLASAAAMMVALSVFGMHDVHWTGRFVVALLWMAIVVSAGAVSILYVLIRRGRVSVVASIFYLVPVSAAIGAYVLFSQVPTSIQLLGALVTAMAVALVARGAGQSDVANETVPLYRPALPTELAGLRDHGFSKWPVLPREQPLFFPVGDERLADAAAKTWTEEHGTTTYVTRFRVRSRLVNGGKSDQVRSVGEDEWPVAVQDVNALNQNIVGKIEVVREFRAQR